MYTNERTIFRIDRQRNANDEILSNFRIGFDVSMQFFGKSFEICGWLLLLAAAVVYLYLKKIRRQRLQKYLFTL